MLLPFDLLLTCHSVHLVKDVNTVQWTGLCVAAATILQSVTYIYMYMCVCVCVCQSHVFWMCHAMWHVVGSNRIISAK